MRRRCWMSRRLQCRSERRRVRSWRPGTVKDWHTCGTWARHSEILTVESAPPTVQPQATLGSNGLFPRTPRREGGAAGRPQSGRAAPRDRRERGHGPDVGYRWQDGSFGKTRACGPELESLLRAAGARVPDVQSRRDPPVLRARFDGRSGSVVDIETGTTFLPAAPSVLGRDEGGGLPAHLRGRRFGHLYRSSFGPNRVDPRHVPAERVRHVAGEENDPGSTSVRRSLEGHTLSVISGRSAPTAPDSRPEASTERLGCGTRQRRTSSSRRPSNRAMLQRSRSVPTGLGSRRFTRMAGSSSSDLAGGHDRDRPGSGHARAQGRGMPPLPSRPDLSGRLTALQAFLQRSSALWRRERSSRL